MQLEIAFESNICLVGKLTCLGREDITFNLNGVNFSLILVLLSFIHMKGNKTGLPGYLKNGENQEKSGNLKIDQKIREKSGNFKIDQKIREFHKIDSLAITNQMSFTSVLEAECA